MVIRRSIVLFLEFAGALLAGLILALAFLTWRLTNEGPIHLGFLKSYVEQVLNRSGREYGFAIDDVVLAWAGWEGVIDVRALNVRILDKDSNELAVAPEIAFGVSGQALKRGIVAPSRLEIFRPQFSFVRNESGDFQFGQTVLQGGGASGQSGRGAAVLGTIVDELMRPPEPEKGTGYLREAVISGAKITIDDKRGHSEWSIENLKISFARGEDGVVGSLDAIVPQFGQPAKVSGSLNFPADSSRVSLNVRVDGFDAAALTKLESGMMVMRGADIPLSGRVVTSIGVDGSVGLTTFRLAGGPGEIALAGIMKGTLPVRRMFAEGYANPDQDMIKLNSLYLDLDGPHFALTGSARGFFAGRSEDGGPPRLEARLTGGDIDWSKVDGWWPMGVADDTREWVIPNISNGLVDDIDGQIAMRVPTTIDTPIILEKLTGSFSVSGMTVHYLRPLPPIEDGKARANITDKVFTAEIQGGHVGIVNITGGNLSITGLDQEDQFIAIGGEIASPVKDALNLLDDPFLGYPTKLGIKPESGSGNANCRVQFDFPAKKSLGFGEVKIDVHAALSDFGLKEAMFDQDVTEGALDLTLSQDGMRIDGPLKLGGIPITLQWLEHFSDDAPFKQQIRAIGVTTSEQRRAFDFDLSPYVEGPVAADLTYVRRPDEKARLDFELDLHEADVGVEFLKWKKKDRAAANVSATVLLENNRVVEVPAFSLFAGDFSAKGSIAMNAEGGPRLLNLPDLRFAKSELTGVSAAFEGDWINIGIGGGVLDAEPWMAAPTEPYDEAAADAAEKEPGTPFRIEADKLSTVRIAEGRHLKDVVVKLVHDPLWWDVIDVTAALENGAALRFKYAPGEPGTHRLTASADDGGEALRALDIYDSIKGGKLTITGEVKDNEPRRPIKGKLEATSFRLINTPFFVRLLSVAALTGLADVLTGEGFYFDGASARFSKSRGLLTVKSFRSAGPSIGITSKGTIDLDRNKVALEGVLVPAYALNTILGNIPVIGNLLLGGGGEGLFSATYKITGDLAEPKIDVNPWAALAPGFLRDIFTTDAGEDSEPAPLKNGNNK